jgi:alanine racemase
MDQPTTRPSQAATNPHGAVLTVDNKALAANWRKLADIARPAECAAVVKADGYGLGIETVVPILSQAGCRVFFVAHLEEGLRVRKTGVSAQVFVLNGMPPGSEKAYQINRLRPVIGTISELARWKKIGGGPAALHVDTGMNRLGLSMQEAQALSMVNDWDGIGFDLLMSHFVSSEERDSPINTAQIEKFMTLAGWFGNRIPRKSLANSSAHFLPDAPKFDMTRAGYAMYGGNPTPGRPNPMRPVVKLEAGILQIRHVKKGDTVGYNAQWTAKRPSMIATISLGYADGWLRSLSATDQKSGGYAMVNDMRCPVVGRVSMDLATIDITDCEPGSVKVGQRVSVLGDGIGVDDVAEIAGTNGYEILTSLGARYQRRVTG